MAQLIIIYPDALEPVLQRAQVEHGPNVATDLLVNWLKDRDRVQEDADLTEIRSGTADVATKARLRAKLGL